MAKIGEEYRPARFTSLKLKELSSVDRPAQPGAKAVIMKRDDSPDRATIEAVAKYVCAEDGAHSFTEVLAENKFSQEIWPFTDALSQSIRSIVGDTSLTSADREGKINASVAQFLAAVRTISPETEKQLAGLISKRETPTMKTVETLEAEIATLKGTHTASIEELTKRAEKAEADLKAEQEAHTATKADLVKATDETITVGGEELRKSEVGEGNFRVAKALRDERDEATFEKRAETEFGHLPGTIKERAGLLKAVGAIKDEEARKAAESVLVAAEKMAAAGFERFGKGFGAPEETATEKAAESTYMAKVAEIRKRDDCTESEAMRKARVEFPAEFAAYAGTEN